MSTFLTFGEPPRFLPHGLYKMDGVPGTGSKIALSFLWPGGTQTGKVLPTGHSTTTMNTVDKQGRRIEASLIDVANPGVYVDGHSLGVDPDTSPAQLDQQKDKIITMEGGHSPHFTQICRSIAPLPSGSSGLGHIGLSWSPSPQLPGHNCWRNSTCAVALRQTY